MPERLTTLEKKNPHARDARIVYVDETHTYFLDGVALPASITALIHNLFPQFDPTATIEKYYDNWGHDKFNKYFALINYLRVVQCLDDAHIKEEIAKLWKNSGAAASDAGTNMHAEIERFENDGVAPDEKSKEYFLFERWRQSDQARDWQIYRTEWSVYFEEAKVAGQIDALYRTPQGEFIMCDWKRCDPTPKKTGGPLDLLGPDMDCFANERGFGPCSHLPNTKWGHYCVQQNLYSGILSSLYGIQVAKMYLIQLHPKLDEAHIVEVPHMPEMAHKIFQDRIAALVAHKRKIEQVDPDPGG